MCPSLNRIVLSLAVVVVCAAVDIGGAQAQRGASPKTAAKASPTGSDTDRVLDGAAKSIESGNADAAMTALDDLLKVGGLPNNHMARALYLRGLAHRKKGRPAQAIADLTSAIWLKDGLGEKDRSAALSARGEASREVGLAAPASGTGGTPAPAAVSAGSPAPQPVARTRTAAASNSMGDALAEAGFTRSFAPSPTTPPPAPEPEAPAASAPSSGPATSSWQSATKVDPTERQRASDSRPQASAEARAPAASPPATSAPSPGGGIGSFFSGLFTGSPSATPTAPPGDADDGSQWRARTERVAKADRPTPAKTGPGTKAFRDAAVRDTPSRGTAARGKVASKTTPISTSAVARGTYRLQLATLRSRKEADAVAARLRKEHAGTLGGRQLDVDETVFGNMGTFYRVRLGPYADVKEPQSVCAQLRPRGYDCLVVTN
jgi:hypothetical protein